MSKENEEDQIQRVANQVENLLMFSSLLIPDIELLEKLATQSVDISSKTAALAPVLGAVGADWEEKQLEADVRQARAKALLNFIKIIIDTEAQRKEFQTSQAAKAKARAQLGERLGL